MKKKIQYRTLDVDQISVETLQQTFAEGTRVVAGVDVAKRKFVAALCSADGDAQIIVRFEHPRQTGTFVSLLADLQAAGRTVEGVMEPTGTYGDPLRYQLGLRSVPVFRVNNKHVHDAAELFDRSPSKHDAKDACLIAWLHAQGRSARWQELPAARRGVRALIAQRELYDEPLRRLFAQIEPLLARHFPELETLFDMSGRKTPYRLLERFGSPAAIAKASVQEMTEFMRKSIRKTPAPELVEALLQAARNTSGQPVVDDELTLLKLMAAEVVRLMGMLEGVDARIEENIANVAPVKAMRPCFGPVTAAVIYAFLGAPNEYQSAAALEKAAGLNLVERSSGETTERSPKHISKRGPGVVRKYLFLAAMRLIQTDPVVKAWYQARTSFTAGQRAKALIAVERKLCRALFHVAAGKPFDATKLFDTRRLALEASSTEAACA